jgi:hypothetical protein
MRVRPWSIRAVLLAVLPLIVGGCGLGGGGSSVTAQNTNTLDQSLLPHVTRLRGRGHRAKPHPRPAPPGVAALIGRAASLSQAEPGLRVIATLTTQAPGAAVAGRSQMTVSDAIGQNAVQARLSFPLPSPRGGVHTSSVRVVTRGGVMYLQPPAAFAQLVSPRRPWWALPLDRLPAFEANPRFGQLIRAAASMNAPGAYLAYLASFASSMNELGHATIGGIRTTHYKALVTVGQAAKLLPGSLGVTLGPALRAAAAARSAPLMAVDVWIDASHLVRRLHLSMSAQSLSGQPIRLSLQQDYLSYLGLATPSLPLARQTVHPSA